MEIQSPRRILAVSLDESANHLSKVIADLTGSPPEPAATAPADATPGTDGSGAAPSLAGTTHHLALDTPYYTARVPIWLDLVAGPADWATAFLAPEAAEVRAALGGLVVVAELGQRELLSEAARLVEKGLGGWGWDGVGLVVVVLSGKAEEEEDVLLEEWEDLCARGGLEMVRVGGAEGAAAGEGGRNEFGEKTGIPRVLEALEANDWNAVPTFLAGDLDEEDDDSSGFGNFEGTLGDEDGEDDLENMNFGIGKEDLAELKKAIWKAEMEEPHVGSTTESTTRSGPEAEQVGGEGDEIPLPQQEGNNTAEGAESVEGATEAPSEEDLQKLESMMRKLQAVRDMSAGLPEDQRRRLAAKAVGEVMRDL